MNLDVLLRIALVGFFMICGAFLWNYNFPISKKLWTSSFVLVTCGLDCLILVAIVYWTDILKKPLLDNFFIVFGKNPLIIYLFSELFITLLFTFKVDSGLDIYSWLYQCIYVHFSPYVGSLLQALSYMMLCWSLGYWMDRKKIYIFACETHFLD